jgi:hypothetical protein
LNFHNAIRPVIIEGRMDFRRATISETHFQDITFVKDVNFSDVIFGAEATDEEHAAKPGGKKPGNCVTLASDFATVFHFVTFEGNAYFLRTCFAGRTSLENIFFYKDANFISATFKGRMAQGKPVFSFSYVNFARLRITWSQLTDPVFWVKNDEQPIRSFLDPESAKWNEERRKQGLEPLSEVLKSLEANFRSQNQLVDANAAYYAMKRAELQEAREHHEDWRSVGRWLGLEALWVFWGALCGYGTKVLLVLGWTLVVNLGFALIYTQGRLHRMRYSQGTSENFTFKPRPWDLPMAYVTSKDPSAAKSDATDGEAWRESRDLVSNAASQSRPEDDPIRLLINALRFSSVVLCKVGYRDTTISGRIGKCDMRWIVVVEWLLGFYLMAALIYTFGSTQPLIDKLVRGVF